MLTTASITFCNPWTEKSPSDLETSSGDLSVLSPALIVIPLRGLCVKGLNQEKVAELKSKL